MANDNELGKLIRFIFRRWFVVGIGFAFGFAFPVLFALSMDERYHVSIVVNSGSIDSRLYDKEMTQDFVAAIRSHYGVGLARPDTRPLPRIKDVELMDGSESLNYIEIMVEGDSAQATAVYAQNVAPEILAIQRESFDAATSAYTRFLDEVEFVRANALARDDELQQLLSNKNVDTAVRNAAALERGQLAESLLGFDVETIKIRAALADSMFRQPNVRFVGSTPDAPSVPNMPLAIAAALIVGAIFAVLFATIGFALSDQ